MYMSSRMSHNISYKEGQEGETASKEDQHTVVLKTKQIFIHTHFHAKVLVHPGVI